MKKGQLFLFLLLLFATGTWAQTTRFVNPDGSCGGNTPCYTTIQAAIDAAVNGDIIQVAAGTYYENLTLHVSIELAGAGQDQTILGPLGTVKDEGSVIFCDGESIVIHDLTITGKNPLVTGPDDYDAFTGIMFDLPGGKGIPRYEIYNVTIHELRGYGISAESEFYGLTPPTIRFTHNTLAGTQDFPLYAGMLLSNAVGIIDSNSLSNCWIGIWSNKDKGLNIQNNNLNIITNGIGIGSNDNGVRLFPIPDLDTQHITRNLIYGGLYGIYVNHPEVGVVTSQNIIMGATDGIKVSGGPGYVEIYFETISGNNTGIDITDTANVMVLDNLIRANSVGIAVSDSGNMLLCAGNEIITNPAGGILIAGNAGLIGPLVGNIISDNGYVWYPPYGLGLQNLSLTPVDASENLWGDLTGPYNDPLNLCGLGNAVEGLVDFSPWYLQEGLNTINGVPELTLSGVPEITSITNTPVIISETVTYPDLTGYDPSVLTDALISTPTTFPAGTKVFKVVYTDGANPPYEIPVSPAYDLSGLSQVYLSDILGSPANPLAGHSNKSINWQFFVEGAADPATNSINIQPVAYTDKTGCISNLGAADTFNLSFDTLALAILVPDTNQIICDSVAFIFAVDYPVIQNIDHGTGVIKNNARITSSVPLPECTLWWAYNSWTIGPSYPIAAGTTEIYLSDITGMTAPLEGHSLASDFWAFLITGPELSQNDYKFTVDNIAQIDSDYVYNSDTTWAMGLPEVTMSPIDDINTITNTPVIIAETVTYPATISCLDFVLTDALISANTAFPANAVIEKVTYDQGSGISTFPVNYNVGGMTSVYLSDILGTTATPLNGHDGLTIDWTFTVSGFDVPWAETVTITPVAYGAVPGKGPSAGQCESVIGTPESFLLSFQPLEDVFIKPDPSQIICDKLDLKFVIKYPLITNVDNGTGVIKNNALLVSGVLIPAGTVIDWSYDGVAGAPYTLADFTDHLYLSEITGVTAPLQGHGGEDYWTFTLTSPLLGMSPNQFTITNIAQLDSDYVYNTTLADVRGLPKVVLQNYVDNISTITHTPVIIRSFIGYPGNINTVDELMTDVKVTASAVFPADAIIERVEVNMGSGITTYYTNYSIGGMNSFYISDVMGVPPSALNTYNSIWAESGFVVSGFNVPYTGTITISPVAYVNREECESVIARPDSFDLAFADLPAVSLTGPDPAWITCDKAEMVFEITYPDIVNINRLATPIMNNALLESSPALPAGTTIDWSHNTNPGAPYTLPADASSLYLSEITGMTAPLQGHSGTDVWTFTVHNPGLSQEDYTFTVKNLAQLYGKEYIYNTSSIDLLGIHQSIFCPPDVFLVNDVNICGAAYEYEVQTLPCITQLVQIAGLPSGSVFPVGVTVNTFVGYGDYNYTDTCSFIVHVSDVEPPQIHDCPADITVYNDYGACGAYVYWDGPFPTDNCGMLNLYSDYHSGDFFPVGTTFVEFDAVDIYYNTTPCTFTVTVIDNEPPNLTCNQYNGKNNDGIWNIYGECNNPIYYAHPFAWDNCGDTVFIEQTAGLPTGSVFPAGETMNTFVATDIHGNTSECSFPVFIIEDPVAEFTAEGVCFGNITEFHAMEVGAPVKTVWVDATYNWYFGDGDTLLDGGTDPTHAYAVAGTYNVTLEVLNFFGCSDMITYSVDVYPIPVAGFTVDGFCVGSPTNFTNTSTITSGEMTYGWDFGDADYQSTETNPSYVYTAAGTYNAHLYVTSGHGCTDSYDETIFINPIPSNDYIYGGGSFCEGTEGQEIFVVTNPGRTYQLFLGEDPVGIPVVGDGNHHSFGYLTTPGIYIVLVTDDITNCSVFIDGSATIEMYPRPAVNAGPDVAIPAGAQTQLNGSVTCITPDCWYNWSGDFFMFSDSLNPVVKPPATATYVLYAYDANFCSHFDTVTVTVTTNSNSLYGYVYYDFGGEPWWLGIPGITVRLTGAGESFYEAVTDDWGLYEFNDIPDGTYQVSAATSIPWGGVNSNDALMIMRHFVEQSTLTGLPLAAADVNGDAAVNSADALADGLRFIGILNGFPVGDWIFETGPVTLSGGFTENSFKGLCYGDVNGSYDLFHWKLQPVVSLSEAGTLTLTEGLACEVPVRAASSMEVGAISLEFTIPDNITVLDVHMANPDLSSNLRYHFNDGVLRISWYNTAPLILEANSPLLYLRITGNSKLRNTPEIPLSLGAVSELGDAMANTIPDARLTMPKLAGTSGSWFLGSSYPNPFDRSTTISYSIPENGTVKLTVFNALGEAIAVLVDQQQNAGTYRVNFDGSQYPAGVYQYRIEVTGPNGSFNQAQKMILSR